MTGTGDEGSQKNAGLVPVIPRNTNDTGKSLIKAKDPLWSLNAAQSVGNLIFKIEL